MDDWQSTAFTNRHVHNRGRKGNKNKTKNMDVTKLFGTYNISCKGKHDGQLEIYCLNEEGNALFGELILPGVLHAYSVILAGSRKVIMEVVRGLEEEGEGEHDDEGGANDDSKDDDQGVDEDEEAADDEANDQDNEFEDNPAKQRQDQGSTFEKNSFRSRKFWVRFQGDLLAPDSSETVVEDSGYWIWSGSQTDKLSGTLSCEFLGWKNVKIEGWKRKSAGARDYSIRWNRT